MGSGCFKDNSQWSSSNVSDQNVIYTGEPIPELGICTGDLLSEVEKAILDRLLSTLEGRNIHLSDLDVTQCEILKTFFTVGADNKNVVTVLDALIKAVCDLSGKVKNTEDEVGTLTKAVFNLKCLSVENPTMQNVVNAVIAEVCLQKGKIEELYSALGELQSNVSESNSNIVNNIKSIVVNQLLNSLRACNASSNAITKVGNGADAIISLNAMVPPFTPLWTLAGPENFDATGIGKAERGFCGWYVCNGLNGTPNLMGWTVAGASHVAGIASSTLDPRVAAYPTNMFDRRGYNMHQLSYGEMPVHSHGINDPGHVHGYDSQTNSGHPCGADCTSLRDYQWKQTEPAKTGITIQNAGGSLPHENRQPTVYGLWIMRKP